MSDQLSSRPRNYLFDVRKIVFIICLILMVISVISFFYLHWSTSEVLTLDQLIVELVGFPVAIYSFMIAAREFAASQQLPKPNLYWGLENGQLVKAAELEMPSGGGDTKAMRLILKNEGDNVTTWYLVQFDVPKDLSNKAHMKTLVGGQIHDSSHWKIEKPLEKLSYIFMSNGEFALYSDYPQPLGEIHFIFTGTEKYTESSIIPFIIYSDKSKKVKGELTLNFVRKVR